MFKMETSFDIYMWFKMYFIVQLSLIILNIKTPASVAQLV